MVFLARLHRRAPRRVGRHPHGGVSLPWSENARPGRFSLWPVSTVADAEHRTFSQQPDESGGNMTVSVVIQERPRLLREGLALILDAEPEIELVGSVVGGEALFATLREDEAFRGPPRSGRQRMGPMPTRLPTATSVAFAALRRLVPVVRGSATARARRCGLRRLVSLRANARELLGELTAPVPLRHPPSSGRLAASQHQPARQLTAREIQVLQVHRCRMHFEADRGPI